VEDKIMIQFVHEISDQDLTIDMIIDKIRENIRQKTERRIPYLNKESPPEPQPVEDTSYGPRKELYFLNTNWDIQNNSYVITSHHPYIGGILVRGRQIVHGEVRRYVDPIVLQQTDFNANVIRTLNWATKQIAYNEQQAAENEARFRGQQQQAEENEARLRQLISEYEERLQEQQDQIAGLQNRSSEHDGRFRDQQAQVAGLTTKLQNHEESISLVRKDLEQKMSGFISRMNTDITSKAWLAHLLEQRIVQGISSLEKSPLGEEEGVNYFTFEEHFRGPRQEIKDRQTVFLPYFEQCSCVLDIGCGRGEFLEALREKGVNARGIDTDSDMVAYCRSRNLDVLQEDALTYLHSLEDKSLDGIFIDQVIEHVETEYLIRMLRLCHQKLKHGYYMVIETVNPLSFVSFVNFYIDLTHRRPIHPETLKFLTASCGFREIEVMFSSAVPDESRLHRIPPGLNKDTTSLREIDIYNHNIDLLNNLLFGAQDYAVAGKK
jgi:2-polyprenyl-3-methyl-5-hydroxy-6-metoxy-1,4-benzoquinol methylase